MNINEFHYFEMIPQNNLVWISKSRSFHERLPNYYLKISVWQLRYLRFQLIGFHQVKM